MPYRFKFDESVKAGFRRIVREQLEIAVAQLSSDPATDLAIHESRKALKRLRALIRCCAPALGTKAARQHNAAIRDIARRMSSRRDFDVAHQTLAQLEAHFGADAVPILQPLKAHLATRGANTSETLAIADRDEIVLMLQRQVKRLAKAQVKGRGYDHAIAGIEAHYRKGQNALKAALAQPTDDALHELRKSVQTHWRHMALLSRAWPDEFAARVTAARELSQLLGDDHDIAMLKAMAGGLKKAERAAIYSLCETRQAEIRAAYSSRARRLYAEPAPAFGRRMAAIWNAGRRIKPMDAGIDIQAASTAGPSAIVLDATSDEAPQLAAKTLATSVSQRRA